MPRPSPERFALVYQCGIANVFRLDRMAADPRRRGQTRRVMEHAYSPCEWYCLGLARAGARVETYHCDEAGDIAGRPWNPGPGDLWSESKRPVYSPATTTFKPES
jgi:hypothetical protein